RLRRGSARAIFSPAARRSPRGRLGGIDAPKSFDSLPAALYAEPYGSPSPARPPSGPRPWPPRRSFGFLSFSRGPTLTLRRVLLSLVLILGAAADLPAQEAAKDDEMLFVQKLRERGYADLALNYLERRLAKDPKYAAEAPLEIALTRAAQAQTEGDAAKRVSLYEQARTELTAFLAKIPMPPRAAAIRLETAGIAGEQGRTQLARAMSLPEGDDSRPAELNRAVAMLDDAAKVIESVAVELKNDKDKLANEFERGLLLVSQGRAYLALSKVDEK